jgi:hypothetical protein
MERKFWVISKNTGYEHGEGGLRDLFQQYVYEYHIPISVVEWDGNLKIKSGWHFGEEMPIGNPNINFIFTIPSDASSNSIVDSLQLLREKGGGAPGRNNVPDVKGIENALPDQGELLEYIINLGYVPQEAHKSVFNLINLAGAPNWLEQLINKTKELLDALTGHGKLSVYLWVAVCIFLGSKLALQKNKSPILMIAFLLAAYMLYKSYRNLESYQDEQKK